MQSKPWPRNTFDFNIKVFPDQWSANVGTYMMKKLNPPKCGHCIARQIKFISPIKWNELKGH